MMRTLGIDLSAQAAGTAWCIVEWDAGRARVAKLVVGADDAQLLRQIERADWTGIDCPFGWPDPMVEAVYAYARDGSWPVGTKSEALRYRATDRSVRDMTRISPLSVSSNWIAVCAWRCASLLTHQAAAAGLELDRIGLPADGGLARHGVIEVYPRAALAMWGLPHRGYKSGRKTGAKAAATRAMRTSILADIERTTAPWLILDTGARAACTESDDALDALISSLVARAAAIGSTRGPSLEERERARHEGWIHLPAPDSLASLLGPPG